MRTGKKGCNESHSLWVSSLNKVLERTKTLFPNLAPSSSPPSSQRKHDGVGVVRIVGIVLNVEVVGVVVVLVVVVVVIVVVVVHIGHDIGRHTSSCEDKVEKSESTNRTCWLAVFALLGLIWFRFEESVIQLVGMFLLVASSIM